jgi:pimeloyl-ACP methyl ester carboxylesterase
MNTVSLSTDAEPAAIVADFERRARRFETPCGDGSIVWRRWGSGPPVLLAHGGHGAWTHWIRNIDALASERTVWALDLPGLGESASPPREDHEAITDAIAAGLRRLIGPDLPLDIVGFSFGGVVSAHLAAFHPTLVRRLIVVDTGGLDLPMGRIDVRGIRGLDDAERRTVLRANLLSLMLHDAASVDELALHLQEINVGRARLKAEKLVLPDKLLHILPRSIRSKWRACRGSCSSSSATTATSRSGSSWTGSSGPGWDIWSRSWRSASGWPDPSQSPIS